MLVDMVGTVGCIVAVQLTVRCLVADLVGKPLERQPRYAATSVHAFMETEVPTVTTFVKRTLEGVDPTKESELLDGWHDKNKRHPAPISATT